MNSRFEQLFLLGMELETLWCSADAVTTGPHWPGLLTFASPWVKHLGVMGNCYSCCHNISSDWILET